MSRSLRIGGVVLGGLLLALGALVLALATGAAPRLLAWAASVRLGREVHIDGAARLHLDGLLRLEAEDVTLAPAADSPLVDATIARLALSLEPWPLLWGERRLIDLSASDAEAHVAPVGASPPLRLRLARMALHRGAETGLEARASGSVGDTAFELTLRQPLGSDSAAGEGGRPLELDGRVGEVRVAGSGWLDEDAGELTLRVDAPHLAVLSQPLQQELPPLGPLRGSGVLTLHDGVYSVSGLALRVGNRQQAWLDVDGAVGDLVRRRHFHLRADFGLVDVRALAPLVGEAPDIGRIEGHATLHDDTGSPGIEEFTLKGGRAGVLEVDAEGRFRDLRAVDGLDARVDLTARDLAVLGTLIRREWPAEGPVEVGGQVTGERGDVKTSRLRLRLDRSLLEGSVEARFGRGPRPRITARLEMPSLELEQLGLGRAGAGPDAAPEGSASAAAPAQVFSEQPLDLAMLGVADLDLEIRGRDMLTQGGPLFDRWTLAANLRDGRLDARSDASGADGASFDGSLAFSGDTAPPTLELTGAARAVPLERIAASFPGLEPYTGLLDARAELTSRGGSPRALAAGLDGSVGLFCSGGTIAVEAADLLTRDLVRAIRRVVSTPPSEVLNCLATEVVFDAGVGRVETLILDTPNVAVRGEGEIDLRNETLQLRLVPRPHRSGMFSTAATVDLLGALADPQVKVVKSSLFTSGTRALLDVTRWSGARRLWTQLRGKGAPPCTPVVPAEPGPG